MCGSSEGAKTDAATSEAADLKLRVADMTCGHCAQTITKAIRAGMPGAKVHADPVSKLVAVSGVSDLAAVRALLVKAGYTPTAA